MGYPLSRVLRRFVFVLLHAPLEGLLRRCPFHTPHTRHNSLPFPYSLAYWDVAIPGR